MTTSTPSSLAKVALAAAAAYLLAACGPNIPATIKIGVAQPLSGPSAARGQDLLNGAKLAVAELNAAGYKIAGKPVQIEIVAMDDKADKEEAKKVAQALVDQKVTAVIGHLSSDITEAVIPIYKAGNVPQLFTSSAVELTRLGEGNTFRLLANDALQARAIAGYLAETLNVGKVAILYEATSFGTPMAKDVTAALTKFNKKVEPSESADNKTTEFAGFVAKLKATPPDALVVAMRDHQLLPLLAQMKAAGLSKLPVIVTNASKTQKVATAPADVNSLFVTSAALDAGEFLTGAAFLAKFDAAYKSRPVWGAHYAYDAVYVLADTMRRADSVEASAIRAKLRTIDAIAPVTNTMRFGADGEQRFGTIAVYQKREGGWQPLMRSDAW
jgi:branched-chain amino acid transport system substrate-binding protein